MKEFFFLPILSLVLHSDVFQYLPVSDQKSYIQVDCEVHLFFLQVVAVVVDHVVFVDAHVSVDMYVAVAVGDCGVADTLASAALVELIDSLARKMTHADYSFSVIDSVGIAVSLAIFVAVKAIQGQVSSLLIVTLRISHSS